jgi:hypothetical protein
VPEYYAGAAYATVGVATVVVLASRDSWELARRFHPLLVACSVAAFLLALGKLLATDYSPFLYFQF